MILDFNKFFCFLLLLFYHPTYKFYTLFQQVPPPLMNEEEEALNLNAIEQDSKLPHSHYPANSFLPPSSSINLQSSSANLHHHSPLSKDPKLSHPLGLSSGSLSSYHRSGGIPGLPPPRAPLGPPGLLPPLHQLGFSKPGPPPLIDIVQKADQIAKQQREQQQLRQSDLGFPPKAHNHGNFYNFYKLVGHI